MDAEEVRRRAAETGLPLDEDAAAAVAALLERVIADVRSLEEELDLEGVEPFAVP